MVEGSARTTSSRGVSAPVGPFPSEFVLRGGSVLDATGRRRADVAVRDGRIAAVAADLPGSGATVVDASGCLIVPGLVDLNCGLGQPGREEAETVHSAARAAALGGYTTLVARADTDPVVDSAAMVREIHALARGACARVLPSATVTVGAAGDALVPMFELAALGVRLFCDDGVGLHDARLLRRALEYGAGCGAVIGSFAQDRSLAAGGHLHEGEWSSRLGLAGIPPEAEEIVVMRDLALARLTGAALHFRTLSTAASWAMVASARRSGLRVSGEVSVAHLLLTDAACANFDPATKTSPPLRTETDRRALVSALAAGDIDALVSDHTPHSAEDKDVPFDEAKAGASSLEWVLALALSELTLGEGQGDNEPVGLAQLIASLSWRPTEVLLGNLGPVQSVPAAGGGRIETGAVADLAVIDPTATWILDPARGASRSRTSPFRGRTLRGRVRHTILAGEPVVL
ncbi:MAG: dihydroorotase, partial [Acidimicrobiales bacterium]